MKSRLLLKTVGRAGLLCAIRDRRAGVRAGALRTIHHAGTVETRPATKYDNSREETRRPNRRAAMVVRIVR